MSRFLIPIIAFLCSTAYAQINIQDKGTGTSTSIGLFGAETTVGKEISDEILAKFEPGKTTYDEVVKELGKPTTERIVKNRTMNMLIVSYVSQKGKVDTNRIALSAIPFIGGLAALAAGRTEVQAEQQNVGFIFDADNKILFAVNNNRSNGQVRERTGIEKLKDAEISIGKPSESAPQNYTPPVQQSLVASTGDVIVPKSGETVRNAIDSKAMIAQLAKISSELKSLSTNDGVIKDPKSLAQKYHNARILSQRGEVDLALKAYAEVLNEQLIFADPIQDLTTLAKRVYGSKGSRNFIEKSLSHLKGRPEYSYALLKIGVEPDFNDWSSVKDSVESFSPLALVYLQNLYNFCFGLGGTKTNPCMKKLYTLPGLEQTSGKLNEIVKNGENLNYYIDSNRSSVDSEDFAGMFGKNAFSVRW